MSKDPILTSTVWKRRSGFAQLSDAITGHNSWEKRQITLHRGTKRLPTRLCYYSIDANGSSAPRGTVYLKSERVTIWVNHHPSDGTQPTPYSLSVLPDGGTKWKFCFDDRNTQFAWLVALSDAIVEDCVKEYNSRILLKEASSWDHTGGFHRLYEENTPGLFGSMRDVLMVGSVMEKGGKSKRDLTECIEIVGTKRDANLSSSLMSGGFDEHLEDKILTDSATQTPGKMTNSEPGAGDQLGISLEKIYQAFFIVNLSVIYVHLTAQPESFIVIPWWQLLLLMNAIIYYVCFKSKPDNMETKKVESDNWAAAVANHVEPSKSIQTANTPSFDESVEQKQPLETVTKSTIGKALLQSEDVPVSEMPTELPKKQTIGPDDSPQQRTEQLTDDEMAAHLHERWAMSAPDCDLSGSWTLIADDSFKAEYDSYLKQLGFNRITRGVACSLIARTTEITKQSKGGRELYLKGTNPKGAWERVLVASGYPDFETQNERKEGTDYTHMKTSIKTADSEDVEAEAWWEERGTMHRSWLKGGTKYGGGDFESLRYLEEGSGGNVLVCESIFHPKDGSKKKAVVKWRFQRDK